MDNYIYSYYQQIVDGSVIVGQWTKRIYEIIVRGLEDKSFFYDHKKAKTAVMFIENFCHHHEGELAPKRLKLELWQKALVSIIFGVVDETGARQFREVFLVVARKNGKTLLAAAIAEYCTFLDGEYGGRIYFAAPKLEQATLCFEAYHQMILQEPELNAMAQKRRTDIYVKDGNTTAKPLAFSAKKSDGLNISLCVADECASWQGDAGLKFYEVIKSSFGARRQPLLLAMSTSGYINDGIYDELMKRATRFLLGDSKESRLLPVLYMIDDLEKWNDINELQKSNPNLGVSVSVDYMLEEIAIAEGSLSKKAEFLTKYCNIKQNSSQAWLPANVVSHAVGDRFELDDFKSSYAVAGIDLSQTIDLTAAVIMIERRGELYVFAHFWLPAEKIDEAIARDGIPYNAYIQRGLLSPSGDNYVDYNDCFNWLVEMVEQYEILPLCVGYDRYSAQYLVQDLKAYGFKTDDVYQGENLYGVMLELQGIMEDGRLHIGDNDLLKMHLLNSAIKMSTERGRGKLVKLAPSLHIDGCAALLDAMAVRQKWYAEIGEQLKNEVGHEFI
ncbi:MAG: terminase large subunit [Clostridiales bacterium]|nr:terminase large subunit [Clostridiales bacterium]